MVDHSVLFIDTRFKIIKKEKKKRGMERHNIKLKKVIYHFVVDGGYINQLSSN